MYLFFVDESVTPPSPERAIDSPYLVLGGLIIHSDDWLDLDSDFKMIKKKFNVTGEIKWRYFQMSPHKKGHSLENLSQDVKEQLRTEIYSLIQKYKRSKTLCVVFNTQNFYTLFEDHNNPKNNADNVYNNAYGIVFGAYNHFLKQRSSKGIMICDNRNPNQDEILRKYHDYKSNLNKNLAGLENFVLENNLITPSHHSLGLQLSDLVLGAVLRKYKKGETVFLDQILTTIDHESGLIGIIEK